MTTRWALVGTGPMTREIAPDFQLCENTEPVMIVSRNPAHAAAFAKEVGVPQWGTLADALRSEEIDSVYIATPHPFHAEAAIAAMDAGKHVLVEKPITMNVAEAEAVVAAARANGRFLMEALWQAFNPSVVELHRRLALGGLGDLRFMQSEFGYYTPVDPASRLWAPELGGGSVLDQAVYTLSLIHSVLGRPSKITAVGTIGSTGVESEAVAVLDFENGARAISTSTLRAQLSGDSFVAGTKGRIDLHGPSYNPVGVSQVTWGPDTDAEDPAYDYFAHVQEGNGYVPMLRAVSEAIAAGELEHPYRTHAATLEVMASMEQILRQLGIVWR